MTFGGGPNVILGEAKLAKVDSFHATPYTMLKLYGLEAAKLRFQSLLEHWRIQRTFMGRAKSFGDANLTFVLLGV